MWGGARRIGVLAKDCEEDPSSACRDIVYIHFSDVPHQLHRCFLSRDSIMDNRSSNND